jgi:hypothetical protein
VLQEMEEYAHHETVILPLRDGVSVSLRV